MPSRSGETTRKATPPPRSISPSIDARGGASGREPRKRAPDLRFGGRRQRMEHGQMRGHAGCARADNGARRSRSSQERSLGADLGGDDQRAGHWSRGKLFELLELFGSKCRRRSSSPSTCDRGPRQTAQAFRRRRRPRLRKRPHSSAGRCGSRPWRRCSGRARVRRSRPARVSEQRDRETAPRPAFARSLRTRLGRPPPPCAWRPSQRQMPKMSRNVRTTLVQISAGWWSSARRRSSTRRRT